jgi:hypothetical protein
VSRDGCHIIERVSSFSKLLKKGLHISRDCVILISSIFSLLNKGLNVRRDGCHTIERVSSISSLLNKGLNVSKDGCHIIERVSGSCSLLYKELHVCKPGWTKKLMYAWRQKKKQQLFLPPVKGAEGVQGWEEYMYRKAVAAAPVKEREVKRYCRNISRDRKTATAALASYTRSCT